MDKLPTNGIVRIVRNVCALPSKDGEMMSYNIPGQVSTAYETAVPDGKRVPFGWKAIPLAPAANESPLFLNFAPGTFGGPAFLRLTIALDVREEKRVEAFLPASGRVVGFFDIRYAPVFQVYQIPLDQDTANTVLLKGVGLRMVQGAEPLWIFAAPPAPQQFLPHLLLPSETISPLKALEETMLSLASIQQFGWEEGCVLDGLLDMAKALPGSRALATAQKHLDLFFQTDGILTYEDPRGRPADGVLKDIEATLPFAALCALSPDHPAIDLALNCWQSRRKSDGAIQDSSIVSAEGAYTIAYPMATIALAKGRPDLAETALQQLQIRRERLVEGDSLFLRADTHGSKTFRNWGRAFAWYMLGMVRTGIVLKEPFMESELQGALCEMADVVAQHQVNGLWCAFVDDRQSGVDTSATAGIAAALALGAKHGLIPSHFMVIARSSLKSLASYLTPDGFLTGAAQSNRGGDTLQRNGYRVISQMAMGLMAQLYVAAKSG